MRGLHMAATFRPRKGKILRDRKYDESTIWSEGLGEITLFLARLLSFCLGARTWRETKAVAIGNKRDVGRVASYSRSDQNRFVKENSGGLSMNSCIYLPNTNHRTSLSRELPKMVVGDGCIARLRQGVGD